MKAKRVEYQKFLRTKLEQENYRELFGLSENIELVGEEDVVLQREFRIDFVFHKIDPTRPLEGIFFHFKTHNLYEFKSVNDAFGLVELRKYLGELFWWLYTENGGQLAEDEVTLTIMTVRKPANLLRYLQQPHLEIGVTHQSPGHYRWLVMGIEVHIFVINELDLVHRHYAWLTLAEGKKYKAYQRQLTGEIFQNESYQTYLDILRELEEEGKERMAYEVVSRIINEMPFERLEAMLVNTSEDRMQKLLMGLPTRHLQKVLAGLRIEQLQSVLSTLPSEQLQSALTALPAEQLQSVLSTLPAEQLQSVLSTLPSEQLQSALTALPAEQLQSVLSTLPAEQLQSVLTALPTEQLQSVLSTLPAEQLQSVLSTLPAERLQNALTSLPSDKLRTIRDMLNQIDLDG